MKKEKIEIKFWRGLKTDEVACNKYKSMKNDSKIIEKVI